MCDSFSVDVLDIMIRSLSDQGSKWKVLVLDQAALRIVNSVVKMNELTDSNITCNYTYIYLCIN